MDKTTYDKVMDRIHFVREKGLGLSAKESFPLTNFLASNSGLVRAPIQLGSCALFFKTAQLRVGSEPRLIQPQVRNTPKGGKCG